MAFSADEHDFSNFLGSFRIIMIFFELAKETKEFFSV